MRSIIASSLLIAGALLAAPQLATAQAPAGSAAFCLKSTSGVTNCIYQTMAACEQVKLASDQCLSSAAAGGTTGQGSPQTPGSSPQPPSNQRPPMTNPNQPSPAPAPQGR
jgi:hypothetical protein